MITDMTNGQANKILWRFTLPMLLSVMFQQLYNIVDSVVAGQFVGVNALAAVGASYPVTMIFMAIANGANIGSSVVISQLFGGKRLRKMKTAVSTAIVSSLTLAAVLTLLGALFTEPLMRMMKTPADIFSDSAEYLRIYVYGLCFLFLYNICTAIFTALGDSKTPLYFLIFSSVLNIILDILFVTAFQMGVAGVAWATLIAQGFSSFLALFALLKRLKKVECEKPDFFSLKTLGRICYVAIPSILQQSFISVGNLFVQGLINGFGSAVVAGFAAATKLNTFTITTMVTLGNSVSSFTAQNIGARKFERVKEGFKAGVRIALLVAVPFFIAFFLFPSQMMQIFVSGNDTEVIRVGVTFLRIVSPFYFLITIKLVVDGILRGSGAMLAFMTSTFSDLVLRVVLCFVLSPVLGEIGIWVSWPSGWVLAIIFSAVFYFSGTWKKHAIK